MLHTCNTFTGKKFTGAIVAVLATIAVSLAGSPAIAANPPFIDPAADWLTTVNYFRAMGGVGPVAENPSLSGGDAAHSCYMLFNGLTHEEVPGLQGFTLEGQLSGRASNVSVSSTFAQTPRHHIEAWMAAPFHAIGILRPNLKTVGFGTCDNAATPQWHSGASLDVIRGLGAPVAQLAPVLFPGDGTTTSLTALANEVPDPLALCGWSGPAGLPIIAMMPEGFSSNPTASVTSAGGAMQVCVLSALNTTGVAQQILAGNNAVVVMPRTVLTPGTYAVAVSTSARAVNWSFVVDPAAATGVQPVSTTKALGNGSRLQALAPARIVDTRSSLGTSRLNGSVSQRIQVTGQGGVPAGSLAVSANFTITGATTSGFLTVWNCSADRPEVSTLNFASGETVPNGASVPLDATGGVCVYSSSTADLLVDVNGYYGSSTGGKFSAVASTRLMDSRVGLGAPDRLAAGSVTALRVTGVAGVPAGVGLVVLNITSVLPSDAGFVTAYPCDDARPVVSSLNPEVGSSRPNLVISPVAADGSLCLYTNTDVDLIVDITGYVSATGAMNFTPAAPFRLTDTRDRNRLELNNGTLGAAATLGQTLVIQVAGVRGIAAGAKAVSANITAVGGLTDGYVTAWPCGARPGTSSVNFEAGEAVANGTQIPLSASGQICVYVSNAVHVIVDVNGWWS